MYQSGYHFTYNAAAFINYLLDGQCAHNKTPELVNTPHYPFHAIKNGTTLFLDFLSDLNFGDAVGLVAYASDAHWLTGNINSPSGYGPGVDLSNEPISREYDQLNQLQRYTQAAHFSSSTAMGDGILEGLAMINQKGRAGARKTMLIMTDGNANVAPYYYSVPEGFTWKQIVDEDGNPYTTSTSAKKYAIYQAYRAVQDGCTIHTMSVGADADSELMEVIAKLGGGIHIHVDGGQRIADMQAELLAAFNRIAAKVPPPRLIN